MRAIEFRGKRIDNGEWVEGSFVPNYIHHNSGASILEGGCIWNEVFPETVGQFTGLYDKNYRKIFEGDILKNHEKVHSTVIWEDGCFVADPVCELCASYITNESFEIIGTIHDKGE